MSTSLIAPLLLALLLPLLVWFAGQLFARGLSTFSAHFEIDRRLRQHPRAGRRLLLQPWMREAMALEAWQAMPPGREKDGFARLLRRHDHALSLQTGMITLCYVALIALWRSEVLVWGLAGLLMLIQLAWRLSRRRLARQILGDANK